MAGFKESNYVFTDPVRYFKENDPYYWEVDNIPLKQLQENCLWLKDQIASNPAADGIDRNEINELRPYVEGNTNIVKVKPGRFTARINDAYNKNPLQKLSLLTGLNVGQFEQYNNPSGLTLAQSFVSSLQSATTTNALSLNGLVERVLTWPVFDTDLVGSTSIQNSLPSIGLVNSSSKWPLLNNFDFFATFTQAYGAGYELPRLGAEFVKQFRGVARTAIVDVPEELSIQIPNFDENDFFTITPAGEKQVIPNASVRIDLLFVYSKPVDVSSTTIQKWSGGQPVTITKPVLGIVRGAGVGISPTTYSVSPARDAAGNTQILADYKDASITTNGFQATSINVHGSFPSPDDLMNLAPVISERLSETDAQLIGQSILPLAYVVVRKTGTVNSLGNIVLGESDILDIRPFFRTAELTYNERAGLAAALPSPSLANPVATQYAIDAEASKLKSYIDAEVTRLGGTIQQGNNPSRTVAGGTIWGGLNFGPEGAINAALSSLGITENVFTDDTVPALPDWDLADWWTSEPPTATANLVDPGTKVGDRINFSFYDKQMGQINNNFLRQIDERLNGMLFLKKRINIDKTQVSWMADYEVKLSYKNCYQPNTDGRLRVGTFETDDYVFSQGGGLYYEKFSDHFIIYCIAPINLKFRQAGSNFGFFDWGIIFGNLFSDDIAGNYNPRKNRDSTAGLKFHTFTTKLPYPTANNGYDVLDYNINSSSESSHRSKNPIYTTCVYPTISFEVVGYPSQAYNGRLSQSNTPTIQLK
jgi:hypothetical protein